MCLPWFEFWWAVKQVPLCSNTDSITHEVWAKGWGGEVSHKLAANARELVESRFDWDSVVDRFDALFRQLLERRAGGLAASGRELERA
jgi:hypothetical protein